MIGKILGGRYEILEKIGSGGMSVVYRAHCLKLNRDVAVKVLRNDLDGSDDFIKRFNVEAQAAASLTHPNIVSVYDVGSENDTHYIVMELVTGVTLKEYVRTKTVLKWQEALKIGQKIAGALEEAHSKHIVHRDVKPQNIIVTTDGNIKVTDFGIAKAATTSTVSIDNDVLGSVHYISPEQARGGYVDEKSDIYSLGIVMYEMLTGKVPFEGETPVAVAMKHIEETPVSPRVLNSDIPEGIEKIVLKAMNKETRFRYQTVSEMKDDLDIASNDPSAVYIPENIPDDAPTQKVPALKTKEVILNLGPNGPEYTDASVKREKTSSKKLSSKDKKTILLAVIASVLIVFCGSLFVANALYGFSLFSFSNSEELVPNLVGMTVDEANEELKGTKFTLVEGEKRASSDYDEGVIIEQNPKAKRTVKDNTEITVVVSAGSKEITLDDYTNEEYRSVELELTQLDLDVKIVFEQDEEIEENYIIKQSPVAGKKIKTGGTVTLYVSEGNREGETTVPNLIGKSESEAKELLSDADLILGEVSTEKSSKDKDTVIRQSVSGGEFVAKNTKIDIVLSAGDSEGTSVSQKEKTLTISLPQEKEQIDLKIVANNKTVYQGIVYPSKTPEFTRKFKGSSVVKFDIYMDGTLVGSKTIDFSE